MTKGKKPLEPKIAQSKITADSSILLGAAALGRMRWSGIFSADWEILIYERERCWEACFFKGDIHHEHTTGFSLSDARIKAEKRIRKLENPSHRRRAQKTDVKVGVRRYVKQAKKEDTHIYSVS